MIDTILVKCINADKDSTKKLKEGMEYIVTRDVLAVGMWYLLEGLENEAAYPCSWFEIVDRNYEKPVVKDVVDQEQLSLFR